MPHGQNGRAQHHEDGSGDAVERLRRGAVGKQRRHPGKEQRAGGAEDQRGQVRKKEKKKVELKFGETKKENK